MPKRTPLLIVSIALFALPAYAQEAAVPVSAAAAEATPSIQQGEPPVELPEEAPTPRVKTAEEVIVERKGSLMFDSRTLQLFYDALGGSTAVTLPGLIQSDTTLDVNGTPAAAEGEVEGVAAIERPNFQLNSIVYFNDESWSVWMNNNRIRNHFPELPDGVSIKEVYESAVVFIWQTPHLDVIAPNWKSTYSQITERSPANNIKFSPHAVKYTNRWDYVSPDGNILVDSSSGTVNVTLSLHQTFVSSTMQVAEGYVAPVPPIVPADTATTVSVESEAVGIKTPEGTSPGSEKYPRPSSGASPAPPAAQTGSQAAPSGTGSKDNELDDLVKDVFEN